MEDILIKSLSMGADASTIIIGLILLKHHTRLTTLEVIVKSLVKYSEDKPTQ